MKGSRRRQRSHQGCVNRERAFRAALPYIHGLVPGRTLIAMESPLAAISQKRGLVIVSVWVG